ncbi:D-lactate dehydrogenase [Croceitalea sp. MTPC9]|uniref:2-hydroxyacid dehydrogenase n=1 Tax=unclassified Croceitalea TaxID=2632280 RepID=UPI002B3FDD13|nr:D-lactate dehydrogenase [Croceitalea sp. MTPC6]GMN18010.1 D-lactate dehydrogenase [Croceitalea sp. MTPC9]
MMKLLVYSAKDFEIPFLKQANQNGHKVTYLKEALDSNTAIHAAGYKAISIFSGDDASSIVLEILWELGVRFITLRSSGHNNINLKIAKMLGFKVANAPDYSPHAIAEHAVALLLGLNRKLILANKQVNNLNFLQGDLMGFNLYNKTIGIIGTGRIGSVMVKIMHGFGCKIFANDLNPNYGLNERYGVNYTSLEEVCKKADIISLHIPLTHDNYHLINKEKFSLMKQGVVLINTARGSIVETKSLITVLENGQIGGYCTDVYEREKGIFFKDNSKEGIKDEQLKKLLSFSNVLLTPHQAFMTKEALERIAKITFVNIDSWAAGKTCKNELVLEKAHS